LRSPAPRLRTTLRTGASNALASLLASHRP
jgi:hypothetical protein